MKGKKLLRALCALALCGIFGVMLLVYAVPMEDLSLDLSLGVEDGASAADFDEKGWTVFTQVGDRQTLLEPDGFGGYTGLELGQTFYFSRLMEEKLNDPTLQLGALDRNFSVFLNGELIYTDCPEQDNRIGWLWLPMSAQQRTEMLTISLPTDYHGKVLTIAQSTPEYTEAASARAFPCEVRLYCGYAYESGLISQSFRTALFCLTLFLVGAVLLGAYVRRERTGPLFAGLMALLWMTWLLSKTSFSYHYFGMRWSGLTVLVQYLLALSLLLTLSVRARKGKRAMLLLSAVCGVSLVPILVLALTGFVLPFAPADFLTGPLTEWITTAALVAALVMGTLSWRKESGFYRLFIPLALIIEALCWAWSLIADRNMGQQLLLSLKSGQITYIYSRLVYPLLAAALTTALAEVIRAEQRDHSERAQMQQRQEIVLAGYESLRRHQREVMMLRHDMLHHLRILQQMSGEPQVTEYLDSLIGQNKKIRPVVQSGNEVLDIILNGELSAAVDAGVKVEVGRAEAPAQLPLADADLCSLFMNILGNAVKAATQPELEEPWILLDIHVKSGYFIFICENAAADVQTEPETEETVPKHGLGLLIVQNIVERCGGLTDTEHTSGHYRVRVAIPLERP